MGGGVRSVAFGLTALFACIGFLGVPARASASVLFSEDFESSPWNPALTAYDEDPAAGEDYWGRTDIFAHGGSWSAAAAAVGMHSGDGYPNIGIGPGFAPVVRYDHGMSASMDLDVRATVESTDRVLTFYFAAQTEPWLVDYLSVLGLREGAWETLWTQNTTLTADFYFVELAIPAGIEWISFHFYSDEDNADDMSYLGVFVDDIVLTGTPPMPAPDVTPPGSRAIVATPTTSNPTFDVDFEASDDDSGLLTVELWVSYVVDGTPFTRKHASLDVSGMSAQGSFPFNASEYAGPGTYSFHTIAVDIAGNREDPPASPDAVVVVLALGDAPNLGSLAVWAAAGAVAIVAAVGAAFLVLRRVRRRRPEGRP